MKVLHLATHLNRGGITTYILRLIRPLRERGIEIQVLSSGGECVRDFEKEGAKVHTLDIRTKSELNPKLYLAIPKVLGILKRENIRLVHAHTRVTQVLAFWLQRLGRVPYLSTCHGFYKRRLGRRILPGWGEKVVAISSGVYDHLRTDFGLEESKIQTIANAVDLKKIDEDFSRHDSAEVRRSYGFEEADLVVGVIARLVADKGHEYLIRAAKILEPSIPHLKLLIVGGGREKERLQALVGALGLDGKVCFTGNLADITRPISAMDLFALPAVWREGFGLSIIESMACRKPVIVTNIWALNSLIQNGVTGILIEPKRSDLLAEAIAKLYTDTPLRESVAARGRQMVEDLFTIERMAREMSNLYEALALPEEAI